MDRLLRAALAGSLVVAGCARPGADERTYVGQVTEAGAHRVCIGAPDATGECFLRDDVTQALRVEDCVRVTYVPERPDPAGPPEPPEPYRAKKASPVDRESHRVECPE